MSKIQTSVLTKVKAFHEEENGIEAVQVVMILGIAAVVLIALWNFFPGIRDWVKNFLTKMGIGGRGGVTPDGGKISI